jgi:hypothetical protein
MKKAKKRNPAREPFASKISDAEREILLRRAELKEQTDDEADLLLRDFHRAIDKSRAALEQMANPDQPKYRFAIPEQSDHSARATVSVLTKQIDDWTTAGAKAKRTQRKAGIGRHSIDNDPETAERYRKWQTAADEIRAERKAEGRSPGQRRLAALICTRVPGSKFETVRGWLKREDKTRRLR